MRRSSALWESMRPRAGHLTFVSNPKYAAKARTTRASAVIVAPDFPEIETPTLRSSNPYLTFAHAVEFSISRRSPLVESMPPPGSVHRQESAKALRSRLMS